MDRSRFAVTGWIVALVLITLVIYSNMQANTKTPGISQISQLVRMIQNQTAKVNPWQTKLAPLYNAEAKQSITIPGDEELKKMDLLQLEELWMRYVENIQQACGSQQHMGAEFDGGYHICEKYIQKDNCLMYAFGSRRMYEFEDDIEKTYGCVIHTFDPYDGQKNHQHSKKVTFHALGLGTKDEKNLLRLTSIKKKLNQSESILDILKIDIEGGEWPALPEIFASGELNRVKLLVIEFHICLGGCKDFKFRDKEQYMTRLIFLRNIYNSGFRLYYFRQWTMCHLVDANKRVKTGCHEVHFMKIY